MNMKTYHCNRATGFFYPRIVIDGTKSCDKKFFSIIGKDLKIVSPLFFYNNNNPCLGGSTETWINDPNQIVCLGKYGELCDGYECVIPKGTQIIIGQRNFTTEENMTVYLTDGWFETSNMKLTTHDGIDFHPKESPLGNGMWFRRLINLQSYNDLVDKSPDKQNYSLIGKLIFNDTNFEPLHLYLDHANDKIVMENINGTNVVYQDLCNTSTFGLLAQHHWFSGSICRIGSLCIKRQTYEILLDPETRQLFIELVDKNFMKFEPFIFNMFSTSQ